MRPTILSLLCVFIITGKTELRQWWCVSKIYSGFSVDNRTLDVYCGAEETGKLCVNYTKTEKSFSKIHRCKQPGDEECTNGTCLCCKTSNNLEICYSNSTNNNSVSPAFAEATTTKGRATTEFEFNDVSKPLSENSTTVSSDGTITTENGFSLNATSAADNATTEIEIVKDFHGNTTTTSNISTTTSSSSATSDSTVPFSYATLNTTEQEFTVSTTPLPNEKSNKRFNHNYLYILLVIPVIAVVIIGYFILKRGQPENQNVPDKVTKERRRITPSWVFSEPEGQSSDDSDDEIRRFDVQRNIKTNSEPDFGF